MRAIKVKATGKNGTNEWLIPIKSIAESRADYYACQVDGFEKFSKEWQSEVDWVVKDDSEIKDWLFNNSDPFDWTDYAVKLNPFDSTLRKDTFIGEDETWTYSNVEFTNINREQLLEFLS